MTWYAREANNVWHCTRALDTMKSGATYCGHTFIANGWVNSERPPEGVICLGCIAVEQQKANQESNTNTEKTDAAETQD